MRRKLKNAFIPHKGNRHTPHLLSTKSLFSTICLIALVELFIISGALLLPRLSAQFGAVLPSVITLLTNDVRAQSNLEELEANDLLTNAAQAKADDMALKGYFAHQSPDGSEPWDWISKAGYMYEYAGENLAVNFTDSEEVVKAWRNSPTHNLNLVGPRYTEIGVAVSYGMYEGREAVFIVQMFGSPARSVSVAPAPVSVQASDSTASNTGSVLGTAEVSTQPASFSRIVTSPRTYGTYPLLALWLLFVGVIIIGWGRHHPRALANGGIVVAVLAGVIYMNEHQFFREIDLPSDSQYSATAISAL